MFYVPLELLPQVAEESSHKDSERASESSNKNVNQKSNPNNTISYSMGLPPQVDNDHFSFKIDLNCNSQYPKEGSN